MRLRFELSPSKVGHRRGFTLIELLITIGVIAILSALLLPAISHGKKRAKRVVCLNNAKQFATADILFCFDEGALPPMDALVPSSLQRERLASMARYLGLSIPEGPVASWPRRAQQPKWINCPMAVESGIAEGLTVGGGVYTGYVYLGGLDKASMTSNGFATIVNPGQAADRLMSKRGVLWADILDEFLTDDPRRFEFFHVRSRTRYPDFRFYAGELDGIHRAWSDGSVEWVSGSQLNLSGTASPDLRIRHLFGNYYF